MKYLLFSIAYCFSCQVSASTIPTAEETKKVIDFYYSANRDVVLFGQKLWATVFKKGQHKITNSNSIKRKMGNKNITRIQ